MKKASGSAVLGGRPDGVGDLGHDAEGDPERVDGSVAGIRRAERVPVRLATARGDPRAVVCRFGSPAIVRGRYGIGARELVPARR